VRVLERGERTGAPAWSTTRSAGVQAAVGNRPGARRTSTACLGPRVSSTRLAAGRAGGLLQVLWGHIKTAPEGQPVPIQISDRWEEKFREASSTLVRMKGHLLGRRVPGGMKYEMRDIPRLPSRRRPGNAR